MERLVTLQSLIETHEQPFVVIDKSLRVVAVNRAYEQRFSVARANLLGKFCYQVFQCSESERPCSENSVACLHKRMLDKLEPYSGIFTYRNDQGESYEARVKGFPITDNNGQIYLGEVIMPLMEQHGERLPPQMVGQSKRFVTLLKQLERAALSDIPILLEGETGTGKELAAGFIHTHSRRKAHSMVTVDCTVLGEDLFESELFGHERGAFTGSSGSKKGLFELANEGTLFLDEIGEMPLAMQVKLLRALETGTYRRVGGTRTLNSDVRVICATNRSLSEMVRCGEFRQDLYYRIAVFGIRLPSLRERREDIPSIAASLLEQISASTARKVQLNRQALVKLMGHDYPGNVRELRNILQLAATLSYNGTITADDLQIDENDSWHQAQEFVVSSHSETSEQGGSAVHEVKPLQAMEAQYIAELLRLYNGRRHAVANAMGISERTLYRKLRKFGLN